MQIQLSLPGIFYPIYEKILNIVGFVKFNIWLIQALTTGVYRRFFPLYADKMELDLSIRVQSFVIAQEFAKHKMPCEREWIEIDQSLITIYYKPKRVVEEDMEKAANIVLKDTKNAYVDIVDGYYRVRIPTKSFANSGKSDSSQ